MSEPRWLTPHEADVWAKYRRLRRELQRAQDLQLQRDSNISGADYALLAPLSESAEGLLRARDLGAEVGWERSRLSHQISRMEKRGLVQREPCPDDPRGSMVRLTQQGRQAIKAAAPRHVETVRKLFFDPLSPGEVVLLGEMLERLLRAVDSHMTSDSDGNGVER
ncbi:MarR family winged helix-turn-helix transcriptional regulator [Micromonospora sp. 4G57]|uniref:MarR family winged helix-turn-helix transcriptional regulator n=1 Tax=Micromonospora sicca TaxID=2202420 RepID=A0ABU5JLY3_9ACTN|nr:MULTISPECIES: MarR family winged helix-turn-helix transcriptional regulator [unclassified Micromonospora]MDZ5446950.1 MarR family winged helix-turn-helix transcriptional regulator [Micromonospora sp. 4G57]MDZ5493627.1 MarR family winged helix-turn-helix transcriptional regulator [Micromonospora sp. 4G53]